MSVRLTWFGAPSRVLSPLLLVCLVTGGGCQRSGPPKPSVAELEWPELSLSQVEPELAGWLRARHQELREEVLATPGDTKKAAKVFGELGLILDAWEQGDEAALCYRNAASLDPSNPRWPHLEGLIHRDAGRDQEAVRLLEQALAIDPTNPASRVYLGDIELARGDLERAARHFREELARTPEAAAHHGLGQIALQNGQPGEAVEQFRKALELQPQATRVNYPLGQALRDAGEAAQAAATLERAGRTQVVVADPSQQLLADIRAQTAVRLVVDMAGRAEEVTDVELMRFTLTQLARAEGAVEALVSSLAAIDPELAPRQGARLLYAIAGIEIYRGSDELAVPRLGRALELAPDMADGWLKLGNALARRGDLRAAESAFDRAVELEPAGDGLLARATIKLNRRDARGALADLRQLAALRPADGTILVRVAEAREVAGDLEGAFVELQRGLTDESRESAARGRIARGLGDFLIRRGRHDQAVLAYRQSLELDPSSTAVRLALGEVLGHLGRWPEAVEELERVTVEQPANEQAWRGQVVALVLQRDWQRARTRLDDGLAQARDSAILAEVGARMLAASPDPAVRDSARALELAFVAWNAAQSPKRAEGVAIAWGANGRFAEALEWQQRAVRDGLDSSEARARIETFRRSEPWFARSPIELLGPPS